MRELVVATICGVAGGGTVLLVASPVLFWLYRLSVRLEIQSQEVSSIRQTLVGLTHVLMERRDG